MKVVAIALIAVCVIGTSLGQDCSGEVQAFHQCVKQSHQQAGQQYKAKFQAIKAKLVACYTDNGCQPPAPGQGKRNGTKDESKSACQKAYYQQLKSNIETCVKAANPGVSLPQHDDKQEHDWKHKGGHGQGGGYDHKKENQDLSNCANKQAVRSCKQALFNSSKPSQQEKRAAFEARCNAKQQCLAKVSKACQVQMQNLKKSFCQCRQQQAQQGDQIRSGIPACSGVQQKQGGRRQGQHKQQSCDEKDYCQLGYDVYVVDHQSKGHGKGRGEGGSGRGSGLGQSDEKQGNQS